MPYKALKCQKKIKEIKGNKWQKLREKSLEKWIVS